MAVAEQALVQVRVDKELRDAAAGIYAQLGMDIPTAVRMFFKRSVMMRGLPFEANLTDEIVGRDEALNAFDDLRAGAARLPEMTLDEINDEIHASRVHRRMKL